MEIGRHYGDQRAQEMVKQGQIIEQSLKNLTTNRQLQGLGSTLSQLNPETPDYQQQLIKVGTEFPLAMQDPRGQMLMMMGAKANAQWQQTQQGQATLNRQIGMENLRTNNDIRLEGIKQKNRIDLGGGGVDLSGVGLPEADTAEAPAPTPAMGMRFGAGMPRLDAPAAAQDELPPLPQETPAGQVPMQAPAPGMSGLVPNISSDLAGLAAAQKATGLKPTRTQVGSAIASGYTRRQQDKRDAERARNKEIEDEQKSLKEERRQKEAEVTRARLNLAPQLRVAESDVSRLSALLKDFMKRYEAMDYGDKKAKEGELNRIQSDLDTAGRKRDALLDVLKDLEAEKGETPEASSVSPSTNLKRYKFEGGKPVPK